MKISNLITKLQKLQNKHGDIETTCVEQDLAYNASDCELTGRHIKVTNHGEKKIHIGG